MVYSKKNDNPTLYINTKNIQANSNQQTFRRNYLQEFMYLQAELNSSLTNATKEVSRLISKTSTEQQNQFNHVFKHLQLHEERIEPLKNYIIKQEEAHNELISRFETLNTANQGLLEKHKKDELLNQAIIDQLTIQDTSLHQLTKKVEHFETLHSQFHDQLAEQLNVNESIKNNLELQESFHQTILERVESQDAIHQKMARDMDSLRATLFERINYVVEKIEENYKQVSGYIFKLFNKANFKHNHDTESEKKKKETVG